MRAFAAAALACMMLSRLAHAQAPLQPLDDLARDGRAALRRGVPLLVLFSLPGCPYCEVVRRNYLMPLSLDGAVDQRTLVREADMSSTAPFRGFHGDAVSGSALAKQYAIRVAPSVLLLDGRGRQLAPVLEGGDVAGMYGAYLDDRLDTARRVLRTGQ